MMKQFNVIAIVLLITMFTPFQGKAYDFEVDGLCYDIVSVSNKTCALTKGDNAYSGIINIPDSVAVKGRYMRVIAINNGTFEDSEKIEELIIPSSVVYINGKVFKYGSSIGKIQILYGEKTLNIGGYKDGHYSSSPWVSSLKYCNPKEVYLDRELSSGFPSHESIEKLTIGSNLNHLDAGFFNSCTNLKQLIIEDSSIPLVFDYTWGQDQFKSCPLTETYIGRNFQFYHDTSNDISPFEYKAIEHLTLGSNVTILERDSFKECSLLNTVNLANIKDVGAYAFYNCKKLKTPIFPTTIKKIGYQSFYSCKSFKEIYLNCDVETISDGAFAYCDSLTKLEITGLVKTLERSAFGYCKNLSSITFGEGLESIGDRAFAAATIDSIILPNSLKTIDDEAFYACFNLKKISLGANIEQIGEGAFNSGYYGSIDLDSIIIRAAVPPSIEESTFSSKTYLNCVVKVSIESENVYKSADVWKNFWNIEGYDNPFTGIKNIEYTNSSMDIIAENGSLRVINKDYGNIVRVFDIHGAKITETSDAVVHNLSKGVYIVTVGAKSFKVSVR